MIGQEFTLDDRTYKIVERLGNGAFGVVYRAVHEPTSDFVAVKVMGLRQDSLASQAMKNEIDLAGKIRHPNVVSQLGANLDPKHPLGIYIVMEYVSGGTLKDKLSDCRAKKTLIPLEHATKIMLQIAQGAKAINEHLVHRDIKPDNILFDGKNYKITDFGIAKVISETTRDHTFKGIQHPRYRAPENWLGNPNSEKMDIYSVGLFFYELLTLKHPLEEAVSDLGSESEWQAAHISQSVPDISMFRPEIEPNLSQLLQRMTTKRAESRPAWDEVIGIIDGSKILNPKAFDLSALVRADIDAGLQRDAAHVRREEQQKKDRMQQELIAKAIADIAEELDQVILAFNRESNYEKFDISKSKDLKVIRTYKSGEHTPYILRFFQLRSPVFFPNSHQPVLAAGYIGTQTATSSNDLRDFDPFASGANLLLVKVSEQDFFGEWRIGSIKRHVTVNHKQNFSIDNGFSSLEQLFPPPMIQNSRGQIVTNPQTNQHMRFRTDVQQAFVDLLTSATELAQARRPNLI